METILNCHIVLAINNVDYFMLAETRQKKCFIADCIIIYRHIFNLKRDARPITYFGCILLDMSAKCSCYLILAIQISM